MKTGRPPLPPEARAAVLVTLRLTTAEAADLDAARGTLTRAAWVRMVAVKAARGG